MKYHKVWFALMVALFAVTFIIPQLQHAQQNTPSISYLNRCNLALQMEGFQFGSGLQPDKDGKPNKNGLELVPARWFGSGFIATSNGSVVTNYHVARRALGGLAKFDDKNEYEIHHIKAYDPINDLAILEITSKKKFAPAKLGNIDYVQPLDKVIAVGNPMGMGINMTEGQVSQIVKGEKGETTLVRHTAPIAPGNSGGGLYKGDYVVGINASAVVTAQGRMTGFNQAIPINKAKELLKISRANSCPLRQVFSTDANSILKKLDVIVGSVKRLSAATYGQPGIDFYNFRLIGLVDYMIVVESPGNDLALFITNSNNEVIGISDIRTEGFEGIFISSEFTVNVEINVVNYNRQPVNYGIRLGYIAW